MSDDSSGINRLTPGYSPLGEVIIGASGVLKIAAARGIKYPDGPRNDLGSSSVDRRESPSKKNDRIVVSADFPSGAKTNRQLWGG